jgi:ABC-type lipoprotein export system ATPase subunit
VPIIVPTFSPVANASVWRLRAQLFTANLDTHNATQLIDLMRGLNQHLGLTFLFSTHDQRLLQHTPRIVRLTDGEIESDSYADDAAFLPAAINQASLACRQMA